MIIESIFSSLSIASLYPIMEVVLNGNLNNSSNNTQNYAFLIGNNDYKNLSALKNPINDIKNVLSNIKFFRDFFCKNARHFI